MRYTELNESGSIHWEDEDFDADNPTVLIRGYGTLKYESLQKAIARDLADMSNREPVSYTHLTLPTTPYV